MWIRPTAPRRQKQTQHDDTQHDGAGVETERAEPGTAFPGPHLCFTRQIGATPSGYMVEVVQHDSPPMPGWVGYAEAEAEDRGRGSGSIVGLQRKAVLGQKRIAGLLDALVL